MITHLALLFVVTTIGALISGLTGMAGGAVILGGLMFFYPAAESLALHGVIQTVSNGARVVFWWRSVHWNIVLRYIALMLPGAWLGGMLFVYFNLHVMEAILGLMILALVWVPFPKKIAGRLNHNVFIWLGLLSGFFSVLAGVVGPLLNPFFDKLNIKREEMVSTKSACQLILHLVRILTYAGAVGFAYEQYSYEIALLIGATIIGILLARPVGKKITDRQLDLILKFLLTVIGVKNVVNGVTSYLM